MYRACWPVDPHVDLDDVRDAASADLDRMLLLSRLARTASAARWYTVAATDWTGPIGDTGDLLLVAEVAVTRV